METFCRGQYFDKHLKFIQHNVNPVDFTKRDLSYLLKVDIYLSSKSVLTTQLWFSGHGVAPISRAFELIAACAGSTMDLREVSVVAAVHATFHVYLQ